MACYACAELQLYRWRLMRRAFGVDQDGLEALLREGVFHLRTCKLCDDGVVVKGARCLLAWGHIWLGCSCGLVSWGCSCGRVCWVWGFLPEL